MAMCRLRRFVCDVMNEDNDDEYRVEKKMDDGGKKLVKEFTIYSKSNNYEDLDDEWTHFHKEVEVFVTELDPLLDDKYRCQGDEKIKATKAPETGDLLFIEKTIGTKGVCIIHYHIQDTHIFLEHPYTGHPYFS